MSRPSRVAVLAPMPSELAPLRKTLALRPDGSGRHVTSFGGVEVIATTTGIGTAAAGITTERLLDAVRVDHVLVVGIAGGVGSSQIGDVIVPSIVVDGASGSEHHPTHLAGSPRGTIVTSDEFLVDPARLAQMGRDGVVALDMETSAVAAVCEARDQPWSVVRAISDRADDHPDAAVLGLAKPDGSPNLPAVVRFVLRRPSRIPQLARLARDARAAAATAAGTCADHLSAGAGPEAPPGA